MTPKDLKNGSEQFEKFNYQGRQYFQYDYRHINGCLFACVSPTLKKARERRDNWLLCIEGLDHDN